ncbi:DUF2309 domain-containing protein [Nitrospira sp. Kam-Ns4a]
MPPTRQTTYPDTVRMELRSLVKLASEVVAPFWPMRTFIYRNPLHELEYLDFDEAVRRGEQVLGGRGYLPPARFRDYVHRGRIRPEHLDAALAPLIQDKRVAIGPKQVAHSAVLKAHLLHGIGAPPDDELDRAFETSPDRPLLERLCERLQPAGQSQRLQGLEDWLRACSQEDRAALGTRQTLAAWCDRTLGSRVTATINHELIKWCGAFFDEGQATWAMPARDKTFYGAWKGLAAQDVGLALLGIADGRRKVAALPDRPEDAVLASLAALGVPKPLWQDYLALHLGAMPGWAGYIKWRANQVHHPWQQAYPGDLVMYLAIRLFYERELVASVCARELGIAGDYQAIAAYIEREPAAYVLLRERAAGRLPAGWVRRVARLRHRWRRPGREAWDRLAARYWEHSAPLRARRALRRDAWRLVVLAKALDLDPAVLPDSAPSSLRTLLEWLEAFPETAHAPVWQEAFEAGYRERLLARLADSVQRLRLREADRNTPQDLLRPAVQAIFCIDARSERLRRHLEAVGDCETFGFAGFFAVPLCYRGFSSEQETDQCPVLLKPKHVVREIPRSYQGQVARKHRAGARLIQAGRELLHDLKQNVVTPYVMVEAVGWFFALPFVGKTVLPLWLCRLGRRVRRWIAPPIATTLTVDKLSKEEAAEMLAVEQRATIRRVLREEYHLPEGLLTKDLIEQVRQAALQENAAALPSLANRLAVAGLPSVDLTGWVEELRSRCRIDPRWAAARLDRITRTGFTLAEQAFFVENALRMMGLTRNLARLVLVCGHGSTSDNNPYESALDCGACGGNQGQANARVLAAMANRAAVRARLAANGLEIPADTYFVAGQHDTTTDEVELFDLEDVPPTHRKDLLRLMADLKEAGRRTSQERVRQFPDVRRTLSPHEASRHVQRRSADWSQVRPEWGLAGNAAFVIGRRALTRGLDLEGRVFLHSYDYQQDASAKALEIIMTAPLVVTEWINMEYYFSTVDNDVYGSGSKIYHNVTGRLGVMFGTASDLRIGLARQTVLDGDRPFHEPLRLLAVIEAPRERILRIIRRNEVLQRFFDRRWVNLVALEPEDGRFYRYHLKQEWVPLRDPGSGSRESGPAETTDCALQKELRS